MDRDERELVQRCLTGDQAACASLVETYARMAGTVILRATGEGNVVEDLAQEVFLKVFRALPYFDARAKLSTWIYTIAHRVAIDHLRQAGRLREDPLATRDDIVEQAVIDRLPAGGFLDPEATAVRLETDRLIHDGLAQLPEKYRLPLVYAAIDGLDYGTIAEMFGVPVGTVKTLIFRGQLMLRERIAATLDARVTGRKVSNAL